MNLLKEPPIRVRVRVEAQSGIHSRNLSFKKEGAPTIRIMNSGIATV